MGEGATVRDLRPREARLKPPAGRCPDPDTRTNTRQAHLTLPSSPSLRIRPRVENPRPRVGGNRPRVDFASRWGGSRFPSRKGFGELLRSGARSRSSTVRYAGSFYKPGSTSRRLVWTGCLQGRPRRISPVAARFRRRTGSPDPYTLPAKFTDSPHPPETTLLNSTSGRFLRGSGVGEFDLGSRRKGRGGTGEMGPGLELRKDRGLLFGSEHPGEAAVSA